MCWYAAPDATKGACFKLYDLDSGLTFAHPFANGTKLTKQISQKAGKLCKSGLAVFVSDSLMACKDIYNITTATDSYYSGVPPDQTYANCSVTTGTDRVNNVSTIVDGCKYIFQVPSGNTTANVSFYDPCECTLSSDFQSSATATPKGICSLPVQSVLYDYTQAIKLMLQNGASDCHTLDRMNMQA